jgi:hypothetical protein
MAILFRTTFLPIIRSLTKEVLGGYNLGGFKGFVGTETTWTLPSGKTINIQKWTTTSPNTSGRLAPWVMASVIDEPTYKNQFYMGYAEWQPVSGVMDNTQWNSSAGSPNVQQYTQGTLLSTFSAQATLSRSPVNNVAPVLSGSTTSASGQATCNTGTWVGGTIVYSYQWYLESGVGTGVFNAVNGATASTWTITASNTGKKMYCAVKATDSSGSTVANSNQVAITG